MSAMTTTLECHDCDFQAVDYKKAWREHLLDERHQVLAREKIKLETTKDRKKSAVVFGLLSCPVEDVIKYFGDISVVTNFVFWKDRPDFCIIRFLTTKLRNHIVSGNHSIFNGQLHLRARNEISDAEWVSICPFIAPERMEVDTDGAENNNSTSGSGSGSVSQPQVQVNAVEEAKSKDKDNIPKPKIEAASGKVNPIGRENVNKNQNQNQNQNKVADRVAVAADVGNSESSNCSESKDIKSITMVPAPAPVSMPAPAQSTPNPRHHGPPPSTLTLTHATAYVTYRPGILKRQNSAIGGGPQPQPHAKKVRIYVPVPTPPQQQPKEQDQRQGQGDFNQNQRQRQPQPQPRDEQQLEQRQDQDQPLRHAGSAGTGIDREGEIEIAKTTINSVNPVIKTEILPGSKLIINPISPSKIPLARKKPITRLPMPIIRPSVPGLLPLPLHARARVNANANYRIAFGTRHQAQTYQYRIPAASAIRSPLARPQPHRLQSQQIPAHFPWPPAAATPQRPGAATPASASASIPVEDELLTPQEKIYVYENSSDESSTSTNLGNFHRSYLRLSESDMVNITKIVEAGGSTSIVINRFQPAVHMADVDRSIRTFGNKFLLPNLLEFNVRYLFDGRTTQELKDYLKTLDLSESLLYLLYRNYSRMQSLKLAGAATTISNPAGPSRPIWIPPHNINLVVNDVTIFKINRQVQYYSISGLDFSKQRHIDEEFYLHSIHQFHFNEVILPPICGPHSLLGIPLCRPSPLSLEKLTLRNVVGLSRVASELKQFLKQCTFLGKLRISHSQAFIQSQSQSEESQLELDLATLGLQNLKKLALHGVKVGFSSSSSSRSFALPNLRELCLVNCPCSGELVQKGISKVLPNLQRAEIWGDVNLKMFVGLTEVKFINSLVVYGLYFPDMKVKNSVCKETRDTIASARKWLYNIPGLKDTKWIYGPGSRSFKAQYQRRERRTDYDEEMEITDSGLQWYGKKYTNTEEFLRKRIMDIEYAHFQGKNFYRDLETFNKFNRQMLSMSLSSVTNAKLNCGEERGAVN